MAQRVQDTGAVAAAGQAGRSRRIREKHRAFRARMKQDPRKFLAYRAFIAVLGALVVALGIVLLPFPGPGWLVIFGGLGIWATEFTWAQRLLRFTRKQVQLWTLWLQRQSLAVRIGVGLAFVLLLAALAGAFVAWRGVPAWIPFIAP